MKFRNSLYHYHTLVNLFVLHLAVAFTLGGSLGSYSCSCPHNEDGCEVDSGCGFHSCEIDSIGLLVMIGYSMVYAFYNSPCSQG